MNLCIAFSFGIFVLFFQCVFAESETLEDQWTSFRTKFKKSYKSQEEEKERFEIFKENCEFFRVHNENDTMTFKIGVNRDADLTDDEMGERERLIPE
jgi:Cathepsin propeptide inhibitor domain (I29)